jgi:septal ring factor EnvC (AmiA/AmiB activator)
MEEHYRRQDERGAALAGSLDRVGAILEQLAVSQRAQSDYLRSIAEHTEVANRNSATLASTVAKLPESLSAQADAIRNVARQLEVAQESDTQLMHSLQQFGRAVDTLGASGTAQVEALQRLSNAQQRQHEEFATVVGEHNRRFLTVLIIIGVLLLGVIVVLGITVLMRSI